MSPDSQTRVDTDEEELQALVGTPLVGCAIKGCSVTDVDERGPIWLNAKDGTAHEYWVCEDHWDAVFDILGWQESEREWGITEGETAEDFTPLEEVLEDLKERDRELGMDDAEIDEFGDSPEETEVEAESFRKGLELMDDAGRMQDDDDW